jgi:hypothetical protein
LETGLLFRLNMQDQDTHRLPVRFPDPCSSTGFLERLASELKIGRHAAYRHAVQRVLETVKQNYESGEYRSTTEAELMLRKLVEADESCK